MLFSSIAGVRGRRANYVYGATKAGMDALGSGLDAALRGTGARVLSRATGLVVGRMIAGMSPAPLSSTPGEVGRAVAEAVRTGQRVVWVPGALRWWPGRLAWHRPSCWVRVRR